MDDYYEKRKSFTALSSTFDMNQLDQPYLEPMTSSPVKNHHMIKRQEEFDGYENTESGENYEMPNHILNEESEEFSIAIEHEEVAGEEGIGLGIEYEEDDEEQVDDDGGAVDNGDFYCTIIFNGNAVLNGSPNTMQQQQQKQPISNRRTAPTTTIVSQRGRAKNVDMVKYLPGGFVAVESSSAVGSGGTCCCCGCRSRHLLNESSISRCSRRLKRRMPILTNQRNTSNTFSAPSNNGFGSLKQVKCLSRSIYLPSPNSTRKLTTGTRSMRPKSINLDDFERNSIVTISYYGDEANTSNSECEEDEMRQEQRSSYEPRAATKANSYGDLNASVSTNSTQVNDSISNNMNTDNTTNNGRINETNKSVSNVIVKSVVDGQLNDSCKDATSQMNNNNSHVSGEFVISSSAEDLREPTKEGDVKEKEKRSESSSFKRSYVPYKPKSEENKVGDLKQAVNDFATEIIMKPKPSGELEKQLKDALPASVGDIIKKATTMVIKDDYDEVAKELDQLNDEERLKKVEELAKARASIPKKIDLLSVKMF